MAKTLMFPIDLGRGSNERRTDISSDQENEQFFFINFGIVKIDPMTPDVNASYYPFVTNTNGEQVDIHERDITRRNVDQIEFEKNLFSGETKSGNLIATGNNGLQVVNTTTNIFMYMPDSVKVKYGASLATFDQGFLKLYRDNDNIGAFGEIKTAITNSFNELQSMGGSVIGKSILTGLTGAASTTEAFNLRLMREGKAYNPVTEQMFKNMTMRTFDYQFKLIPRNEKESAMINSIIKEFKYHMHPELIGENSVQFKYPSLFVIAYYAYNPKARKAERYKQLHKISACYLEDMDVNYTAANQFVAFKDGQPVAIEMGLKFRETVIQTKESINQDY